MDEAFDDIQDDNTDQDDTFSFQDDSEHGKKKSSGPTGFTKMSFPKKPSRNFTWDVNYKMKGNYPHIYMGRSVKSKTGYPMFNPDNWLPKCLEFK